MVAKQAAWWGVEIQRFMDRNSYRFMPRDRRLAIQSLKPLLDSGWTVMDTIPWYVYRDVGTARVLADCFNTPGRIRLYWKDQSHGSKDLALAALDMVITPCWFPFDDFDSNPQTQTDPL